MGPNLPTDAHFAIGNFLQDSLLGRPILINGNPSTRRSYLYPTDLTVWILNLMANPVNIPMNIGSDNPVEIGSLADLIADLTGSRSFRYTDPFAEVTNYVPDVSVAKQVLGNEITVSLEEGIRRWTKWLIY
jgi:dTDP-glucose 4,6-dehydratase